MEKIKLILLTDEQIIEMLASEARCTFSRKLSPKQKILLTCKASITITADDSLEYYFHCFSEKLRLDISCDFPARHGISCESPARQRIHMKHQALFSSGD